MKLAIILAKAFAGSSYAVKFMEIDALAAEGMSNLGAYIAANGYPSPKTCTLKNAAVRREW